MHDISKIKPLTDNVKYLEIFTKKGVTYSSENEKDSH